MLAVASVRIWLMWTISLVTRGALSLVQVTVVAGEPVEVHLIVKVGLKSSVRSSNEMDTGATQK